MTVATTARAPLKTPLSEALEATYRAPGKEASRGVMAAIEEIKRY